MRRLFIVILGLLVIMLGACASSSVNEVSPGSTSYLMHYEEGRIVEIKPVVIKDDGSGGFLGAITGTVLGSTMGRGRGNTLATLAGGLLGAYAGSEVGKANAQELTVDLDNGDSVVVISKGQKFAVGQRVRIVIEDGRVVSVEHH
ncbi:MAG TPA: glycine zipper 2TM domain-containing protein [Gammaproteobacteria bacterium]|nr:glycine zipper 2TM domain-containing protein [Gammaproteobacteria bacterium]